MLDLNQQLFVPLNKRSSNWANHTISIILLNVPLLFYITNTKEGGCEPGNWTQFMPVYEIGEMPHLPPALKNQQYGPSVGSYKVATPP